MSYIGNNLQVAYPTYKNIDDISGSFNGSTTSFPLTVGGVAPVPAPLSSNQCLISVDGVVQRPDDTGTEGFRLSGGNIIFSAAPAGGVDFFGVILAGADYVNVGVNFPSGTAAAPSVTFEGDLDTGIYNSAANQLSFTTAGVERFRIDSAGQLESVSLGTAAAPAFSFTTDANTGIYSPGADQLAISTGGSERTRIDSSGRLLVGTSSSRTGVFFNGDANANPLIQIERAGDGVATAPAALSITRNVSPVNAGANLILARSAGTTLGSVTAVANNDIIGRLTYQAADGTDFVEAAFIQGEVDGTPGANDMPGRLVFSTTSDGASSPTERMRLTSNGYLRFAATDGLGIQFNDNTAATTALDDYEEGSFTPTIAGTTTVGTGTYSVQVGRYTKIGDRVYFQCRAVWSAHTGTGNMQLTGLPFTSLSTTNSHSAATARLNNLTTPANTVAQLYVNVNSTNVVFESYPVAGGVAAGLAIDAAADVMVSGHYKAA